MKQFFTLVFTILSLSAAAQPLVWPWATALGGRAAINMDIDMAIDSQGNIIVVGNFEGTADFGSTTLTAVGFTDVYIAKMDSSGNVLWAIQGGEDMVFADGNGVAVDGNDNIYVCGRFAGNIVFGTDTAFGIGNRDMFLAKFDPSGTVQWLKAEGGANLDAAYDVACDLVTNDVYVVGSYLQSATFGTFTLTSSSSTDENAFILKYNTNGVVQWALGEGGNVEDRGIDLKVGTDNHVYMSGYFSGSASFDGGNISSAGARDMFVAKYTKSGGGVWVRSGGGPGTDIAEGIGIDTAGNVYACGVFTATATFNGMSITEPNSLGAMFMVKYDKNGTIEWLKKGQPTTPSQVKGLALYTDMNGFSYSAGFIGATSTFSGQSVPSAGGEDGFIAKYSPLGKLMWVINCGGTFNDRALTIEADQNGICTLAGIFINTANFGGNSLTAPLPTYRNFVSRIRGQNVGVGIEQFEQDDASISLFPNPVTTEMNYKYITERNTQFIDLFVYNAEGKLLINETRVRAVGTLSTETLPVGNYILELRDQGMSTSVLFTKE